MCERLPDLSFLDRMAVLLLIFYSFLSKTGEDALAVPGAMLSRPLCEIAWLCGLRGRESLPPTAA
jgi:hypothetical protein